MKNKSNTELDKTLDKVLKEFGQMEGFEVVELRVRRDHSTLDEVMERHKKAIERNLLER